MTTDPFTEAARAEAEALFLNSTEVPSPQDIGEHIAEWARTHLAAQEPTDAEVEAAKVALDSFEYGDEPQAVRAALSAARAARRDEEK